MSESWAGIPGGLGAWAALLSSAGFAAGAVRGRRRGRNARRRSRALLARPEGGPAPVSGRTPVPERGPRPAASVRARFGRWAVRRYLRESAAALGAAACAVTLLGGITGWVAGGVCAYGVWRWIRRREAPTGRSAEAAEEARVAESQLPLAAELMAACLAAGSGPEQAADAVGRSLGAPLGTRFIRAGTELRLGGEPAAVWARFGSFPGGEAFARCMERAGTAGVPAVEPVTRLAAELRARRSRAATARARRAAVLVTGPLGLCFLPAFLAVGVAPVVLGLARSLL